MKIVQRVAVAAGLFAALFGLTPEIAQAANGSSFNAPFANGTGVLPRTIVAGDCRLMGQNQDAATQVTINLLPVGEAIITWTSDMYTVHTYSGDIWRQTFVFKTATGATVTTAHYNVYLPYAGRLYNTRSRSTVAMTYDQWISIAKVDWYGSC